MARFQTAPNKSNKAAFLLPPEWEEEGGEKYIHKQEREKALELKETAEEICTYIGYLSNIMQYLRENIKTNKSKGLPPPASP